MKKTTKTTKTETMKTKSITNSRTRQPLAKEITVSSSLLMSNTRKGVWLFRQQEEKKQTIPGRRSRRRYVYFVYDMRTLFGYNKAARLVTDSFQTALADYRRREKELPDLKKDKKRVPA